MRLVLIEWVDSYSGGGAHWRDLVTYKAKNILCYSVGWLVHDTEECKVVVPHRSSPNEKEDEPQGCGDMTIPTASILKIVDLPQTEIPALP